jgi:glycosyltransferase involved in cell wall biosynthesis
MKKILFATLDDFSNINPMLKKQLQKHFPGYELMTIELKAELRKSYFMVFFGLVAVLYEYAIDFARGRKNVLQLRHYIYHTPFIMKYFNRKIKNQLKKEKCTFVFQTQSLFDSSSRHTPNFIYIDHTNLNNLNYPYIDPREYLCSSAYVKMERQIYDRATLLFVMSANMKASLVQQYHVPPDKVKLVYAGSNTRIIAQVDRKKYATKNILFAGKDWDRKGGPLLVKAFKKVLKSLPDATLTIVGCRPSVSLKNCFIMGEVTLEEIAEYYNKASVFCLPTKREPFGVVFIEAMLNQLPIITNTVGATPDLVINNENGFRLNNDANEYAEALIMLLNDPDKCEQFGKRSYQIAKETYTWDNVGNLMASAIQEELSNQQSMIS